MKGDATAAEREASIAGQVGSLLDRCAGAYADATLRGYRSDLTRFAAWCAAGGRAWLPAAPQTVAAFIDAEQPHVTASTLRRRIVAIGFAHRMSDLANPTTGSAVQLALRRAARQQTRRPAQAQGLTAAMLAEILAALPSTLAGLRDAAVISVGYDTLCRSCELAAMTASHLRMAKGGWSVLIARSKADQAGDGRIAWLSPGTVERLERWMQASGVAEGPLFRSLHLGRVAPRALDTSSVRRLVRRAARNAGVAQSGSVGLSGHSMRVGAAQDMLVAGFDALAIMQAGGWKSTAVLLRYVENASTQALHERRWAALQSIAPLVV